MRELRHVVSALFVAGLASCSCFQPVDERQCDALLPCGSGWRCVDFQCVPPGDGGASGGQGGGRATGGGGTGGGTAGG
ncbi:MAG: hypothetical protein IAE78_00060, partial [Myxococcus sp.]|nr:hypothetical protein [Myxococcus sp.]